MGSDDFHILFHSALWIFGCVKLSLNYFVVRGRSRKRYTNFNPDHVSSIAQIFTSTSPASNPVFWTLSNERSVGIPALFFGHATQIIPFALSLAASRRNFFLNWRSESTNKATKSREPESRETTFASAGNFPKSSRKLAGAFTRPMRKPSFTPSFLSKGVPEYPAICVLPNSPRVRYQSFNSFHQANPIISQTGMLISDARKPSHHHRRWLT